jgi:hypothetical protein|tara:strand:+ start:496 stop:675 length:180 start_codon:yes stop_codon:yes gene_type:complete
MKELLELLEGITESVDNLATQIPSAEDAHEQIQLSEMIEREMSDARAILRAINLIQQNQ